VTWLSGKKAEKEMVGGACWDEEKDLFMDCPRCIYSSAPKTNLLKCNHAMQSINVRILKMQFQIFVKTHDFYNILSLFFFFFLGGIGRNCISYSILFKQQ
jgi:hypothetical protein